MSIRPVDINGMIQRTQDVGTLKQNEDNKPLVEQHNIQVHQQKQEDQLSHQVQGAEEKENQGYRYDAKEKGNGGYEGNQKKKRGQKNSKNSDDKVIVKGTKSSFDVKI